MPQPVKDEGAQAKLIHRRTPTADDFPIPAKQSLIVTGVNKRDQSLVSPSKSSFTFCDEDQPHAMSTPPSVDHSPIARESNRGTPGDFPTASSVDGSLRQERGRKGNQLKMLPFRAPSFSVREKVRKDSVILAEVKTNVIIQDEFLFLNEFSKHLSQRYQKPTSSIFVTLDHSACLLFASSFESAYILAITALPSQVLSSANKRNAALIQSFMTSSLGVLPDRGVVKFVELADENLATMGTTIQGQTERLERQQTEERKPPDIPLPQLPSGPGFLPRQMATQKKKPPALSLVPKSQSMPGSRMPSPTLPVESPALPAIPIPNCNAPSVLDRKAAKMQKSRKRKSIMALFGR